MIIMVLTGATREETYQMQNMFSDDGDAHTNHGNKLSTYSKKLTP